LDKKYFFDKYKIDEQKFVEAGLRWEDLMKVYDDFRKRAPMYEEMAKSIVGRLNREKSIHSIKYRIKDGEHLIEKIIRKTIHNPSEKINVKNYKTKIRDLIGLRVLHLFKEEWQDIHDFICDQWKFQAAPRANYKKGDPALLLESYTDRGLILNEHAFGYRSLHYNIKVKLGRNEMLAEVQLRTLFEEAWSEIDHHLRYSSNKEIGFTDVYLGVLNNITSNADEIASHMRRQRIKMDAEAMTEAVEGVAAAEAGSEPGDEQGAEMPFPDDGGQIKVRDIYKSVKLTNQYAE